jgi:hypothetical protein
MATKIVTKNSSTASAVPTASDLVQGELAVNVADKRLFTEDNGGTIVELGTNPSAEIVANGGIALPDNGKATFGASDDLQIYHNGNNSFIADTGTGSLYVRASDSFRVQTATNEEMIKADADGAVTLYNDNAIKLATTATGIDVTGTATMDGLTVDSGILRLNDDSTADFFTIQQGGTQVVLTADSPSAANMVFKTASGGVDSDRLKIASNGDISFYEDTGTTAKFFWDASAESLGIGTSSNFGKLSVNVSAGAPATSGNMTNGLTVHNTDGGRAIQLGVNESGGYTYLQSAYVNSANVAQPMAFFTGANERMRIDSSGNVGIGASSANSSRLRLDNGGTSGAPQLMLTATGASTQTEIRHDTSGNLIFDNWNSGRTERLRITSSGDILGKTADVRIGSDVGSVEYGTSTANSVRFYSSNTERMRINSAGNVGIGESSPDQKLHVSQAINNGFATVKIENSFGSTTAIGTGSSLQFSGWDAGITANIKSVRTGSSYSPSALTFETFGGAGTTGSNTLAERMRIDEFGNVGIGTDSPSAPLEIKRAGASTLRLTNALNSQSANDIIGEIEFYSADNSSPNDSVRADITAINEDASNNVALVFGTAANAGNVTERMRIDSSGNLLVGKTSADNGATVGFEYSAADKLYVTDSASSAIVMNRLATDGNIAVFQKNGTTVGSIGTDGTNMWLGDTNTGLRFRDSGDQIQPYDPSSNATRDAAIDLGGSSTRWKDIYATNGTIQTSDRNEKQDIAELNTAETAVAVACKGLLRKFRWKDSVAEKGDDARIHFGIIAQDLQAAFEAEGLDAGDYAMFISTTWTDEETNEEKTRMGVRYSELLAFIIAAL